MFALRSGVVCVIPHDRFHVEEDAVDFVCFCFKMLF